MRVTFRKLREQRISTWEAVRGRNAKVPGAAMALGRGDMPHDLVQLVLEARLGHEWGFFGCLARGANFRSTHRKKRHAAGKAIVAGHRAELDRAERDVGERYGRWLAGEPVPGGDDLARVNRLWHDLADGEPLTIVWPTLEVLEPAGVAAATGRSARGRRA